jgi:hypothetical protein
MYTYVAANAFIIFNAQQRPAIPKAPIMLKNSKYTSYCCHNHFKCQSLSYVLTLFMKATPLRWPHRFAGIRIQNFLYVGIKMYRSCVTHKPHDLSVHLPVMEVFVPVSYFSNREAVIICDF